NGEYLDRWTDERKGRIVTAVHVRAALLLHVFSDATLKNKRCAGTTSDDLRRIVARLNARVEAGELEWTTARRVWSQCRCMYRQSFDHELDDLRIRKDDPTAAVRPAAEG